MAAVGFACFGMNLVGVDADGEPCTPVFTYAANSNRCAPSPPASSPYPSPGSGNSSGQNPADGPPAAKDDVTKRLRDALEKTGSGGKGGLEEARRRTGAPTHMSYAPTQLLRWLQAEEEAPPTVMTRATIVQREGEGGRREGQRRHVKVWQTLPSLIAARWCCLASAPVSYSEASWMGLLDLRKLEVRERGGENESEHEGARFRTWR